MTRTYRSLPLVRSLGAVAVAVAIVAGPGTPAFADAVPPTTAPGVPSVPTAGSAVPDPTTPSTATPSATVPGPTGTPSAPVATVELTDDTGVLTMTVPASWTFVDTAQRTETLEGDPAPSEPRIIAATAADWATNWATSSVTLLALPTSSDLSSILTGSPPPCPATGPIQPYDDGYFVGVRQDYAGCGGVAEVVHVVANPPDNSFTAWVDIDVVAADKPAIDIVLDSFNSTGELPYYELTDDTGLLTLQVPAQWSEWTTSPTPASNSTVDRPTIWASTRGDGPTDSSIWYQAYPFEADVNGLIAANDESSRCTDAGVVDYDDGYFVGLMHVWINCDGIQDSTLTQIYANPADQAFTAVVHITFGIPPPDGVQTLLLDSFWVTDPPAG